MFDEPDDDNGDFSYVYEDGEYLSLTFSAITMPDSAVGITGLLVETYWLDSADGTRFDVDSGTTTSTLLQVTSDDFTSAFIEVSEEETYTDAYFAFQMTATNPVQSDGKIRVLLPPELVIADVDDIECSNTDENGENIEGLDTPKCDASTLT